jgi:hypothetical protein
MASDIVAFSLGLSSFSKENEYLPAEMQAMKSIALGGAPGRSSRTIDPESIAPVEKPSGPLLQIDTTSSDTRRSIVVVCPSRELSYPLVMAKDLGAETTTADFSQFTGANILKSAQKWIDLSGSETIWKE